MGLISLAILMERRAFQNQIYNGDTIGTGGISYDSIPSGIASQMLQDALIQDWISLLKGQKTS